MATLLAPRHQRALDTPTGLRRVCYLTFQRFAGPAVTIEPATVTLTQDFRRKMRWDGNLTITDARLMPTRPGDLLTPFGTVCTAQLGIRMGNGSESIVPYGVYVISGSRTVRSPTGRVTTVTLLDLADRIERYRFERPFTVASGTDIAAMVNTVVTDRLGTNPGLPATGVTIQADRVFGLSTNVGPWSELVQVLAGFNRSLWYDRVGQLQMDTVTADPGSAYPVSALVSTVTTDFDTRPENLIVVRGEPPDVDPIISIAMDTNPGSPTYAGSTPAGSPYGRATQYYSSQLIRTQAQADEAALNMLNASIGQGAASVLTKPFDPTIDATDVISSDGVTYAVDAVTVNVGGETTAPLRELV